jgi:hypothetical protein
MNLRMMTPRTLTVTRMTLAIVITTTMQVTGNDGGQVLLPDPVNLRLTSTSTNQMREVHPPSRKGKRRVGSDFRMTFDLKLTTRCSMNELGNCTLNSHLQFFRGML